jgi:hypothetical protein
VAAVRSAAATAVRVTKSEEGRASAAPRAAEPVRLPAGVFAPQTTDPAAIARRTWVNQQKVKFARTPPWAMVAAGGAVVVLVVLVVYLALGSGGTTARRVEANGGTPPVGLPAPGIQPRLVQLGTGPATNRTGVAPPRGLDPGQGPGPAETATTVVPGKVYGAGEVQRTADLVYLVIATSPKEDVADYNAKFLADHGVSVSIEKTRKGYFTIISVQGFAKQNDAAEAFRKKVVLEIGRQHRDYLKNKKDVWADAYYAKVTSGK